MLTCSQSLYHIDYIETCLTYYHIIINSYHYLQLSKLPSNIGKLNWLLSLNVHNNLLEWLPQSIGYIRTLLVLNLSYNRLLYLPATMMFLKRLNMLNITMNPIQTLRYDNKYRVLSLVELSANIILQYRLVAFN